MGETGGVIDWYEFRPAVQSQTVTGWKLKGSNDGTGVARESERGMREGWQRPDLTDADWAWALGVDPGAVLMAVGVAATIGAVMTPAIQRLGDAYGRGEVFLPQMMAAAEAMKAGNPASINGRTRSTCSSPLSVAR